MQLTSADALESAKRQVRALPLVLEVGRLELWPAT
jgi:hypothetical protein